jgi:glycosyltransferase involved in cell wall biosynthesis
MDRLKTIAVDLTPILPGGENGGAKIFVLELLRRLTQKFPQTQFILLTQAASHDELATLDRPNVRRLQLIGPAQPASTKAHLTRVGRYLLPRLPGRLRRVAAAIGYKLNTALKRGRSGGLLQSLGADLLFCPFTAPTYFEAGIPTVCTLYDLQYKTYPEFFTPEDVAHRHRTFIEACRRAAAIAAISDYSRESAIHHGELNPENIRTIHLRMAQRITWDGSDAQGHRQLLGRLGLCSGRYLIFPANFWKHKNHEMLLTAFGIACRNGLPADFKLVCTGSPGERQQWLIRAANTMELADRVLFPGYLSNEELSVLMSNTCGTIFPSLYEGFGLPVIEAMAAGVPVACSNTTSLPEVAAGAAILFDPRVPTQIADAMITLATDSEALTQLVEAGRERAAEFTNVERMASEYWDLFLYAVANVKHESLLTGAYVDGWAGPKLTIQIAPSKTPQTVEFEFSAPEWLPESKLTIRATQRGKPFGAAAELVRGANLRWSLPVSPGEGVIYEVSLSPTFVPAQSGQSDDRRELSAILQKCHITSSDGTAIELFPENSAA